MNGSLERLKIGWEERPSGNFKKIITGDLQYFILAQ